MHRREEIPSFFIYNPTYNNLRVRYKVYLQYYLCKMDICAYLFDFCCVGCVKLPRCGLLTNA